MLVKTLVLSSHVLPRTLYSGRRYLCNSHSLFKISCIEHPKTTSSRTQKLLSSNIRFNIISTRIQTLTHKPVHNNMKTKSTAIYVTAVGLLVIAVSYAAVPMYRIFCQTTSYGGTVSVGHDAEKVEKMQKVEDRVISVRFNADTAASLQWNFKPQQSEIKVIPGETALAFYTATNPTNIPVIGISTYNVIPFEAGKYFNKIQCFCFEEQRLNPKEQVDMPVFFYIDPEFAEDPRMELVNEILLSYTFFEAKEGLKLPMPNFGT